MQNYRPIALLAIASLSGFAAAQKGVVSPPAKHAFAAHQAGSFIENRGQWDSRVKFVARSSGVDSWITKDGVVYDFHKLIPPSKPLNQHDAKKQPPAQRIGDVVKVTFAGSRPAQSKHLIELPGKLNFMVGNDRSKWATGVRRFAEAREEQLYKGISARYYFENGKPRYDIVVAPGADPSQVRMHFEGAQKVAMSKSGELDIQTSLGTVEERGLYAYQVEDGTKREVACRMDTKGNTVGFHVGSFDQSKPLVIDPLIFSTFLGGSDYDAMAAVAVDSSGNIFEGGETSSFDFPISAGAYQNSDRVLNQNNTTCFVAKLSADGSTLLAGTYFGSSVYDQLQAMALDSSGNVYFTGFTAGSDFPVSPGAFQSSNNGGWPAFATKLSGNLSSLMYSTYLGGNNGANGYAIAVNSSGNAVVAGNTSSSNFPTTFGAFESAYHTVYGTCFVTELNTTGTGLVYSTFLGGSFYEVGESAVFDSSGNVIIAGNTSSTDFPVTAGAFQTVHLAPQSYGCGFITKLNPTGTALVCSTFLGGSNSGNVQALALDSAGNVYVDGPTSATDFPVTPGAFQTQYAPSGTASGFISKLNPTLTTLIYSTYLGGNGNDAAYGLAVNSAGEAIVDGEVSSENFPTTANAFEPNFPSDPGTYTIFLSKLSANGTTLLYSSYLGGVDGYEQTNGVALDSAGDAVVAGNVNNNTFPTTPGAYQTQWKGSKDTFITKVSFAALTTVAVTVTQRVDGGTVPDGTVVKLLNNDGTALSPATSTTVSGGTATFSSPPAPSGANTSYEVVVCVPAGSTGLPAIQHNVAPGSSTTVYVTAVQNYITQSLTALSPVAFATAKFGTVKATTGLNGYTPSVWLPDGTYASSFSMSPGIAYNYSLVVGPSSSSFLKVGSGFAKICSNLTRIYLTARRANGTSFIPKTGTWTISGGISVAVNGQVLSPSYYLPNGTYTGTLFGATETGSSSFNVGTKTTDGQRVVTVN